MAQKKRTALDRAVDRATEVILRQLDSIPVEAAHEKIKELEVAAKSYRPAKTGKARRVRRTASTRPSARSRAKTA